MSWAIPARSVESVRRGDRGIAVWALQRLMDQLPKQSCVADGDFGAATERVVRHYQGTHGLTEDGIAGPATQRSALERLLVHNPGDGLPPGLLSGFAEMEGGWLVAATNSDVAGGIDCGVFQRRVYAADYGSDAVVQAAFDSLVQLRILQGTLSGGRLAYVGERGTNDRYGRMGAHEKAWRLAALFHNYPAAAVTLAATPIKQLSSFWKSAQGWVLDAGFRFPDGAPVQTPLEWCHLYAGVLAGAHAHEGTVTRYVTRWP